MTQTRKPLPVLAVHGRRPAADHAGAVIVPEDASLAKLRRQLVLALGIQTDPEDFLLAIGGTQPQVVHGDYRIKRISQSGIADGDLVELYTRAEAAVAEAAMEQVVGGVV